jgi:threonine dehydrogenase-like Zn-dependent dehydrogenase
MRAFVVTGPFESHVIDVEEPKALAGSVVVDVHRVGVCGTDVEFFRGEMQYLHDGHAHFPMRLGHEWMGVVSALGDGVDATWLGRRVTGDTMLGCGVCRRCVNGHQHVCESRKEVGVRGDFPGALAEKLTVPVTSLHSLPDSVDDVAGAMVEPGGNALRSVWGAGVSKGERLLVIGPGTIGLLVALIAKSRGVEVHVAGIDPDTLDFARSLGVEGAWEMSTLPDLPWDSVVNATSDAAMPQRSLDMVEPGGRVVYIGISEGASLIDSQTLTLKDVTAVGILSASPGLKETIDLYASAALHPQDLVAATVGLDDVDMILRGERPLGSGPGPKMHVDPRR